MPRFTTSFKTDNHKLMVTIISPEIAASILHTKEEHQLFYRVRPDIYEIAQQWLPSKNANEPVESTSMEVTHYHQFTKLIAAVTTDDAVTPTQHKAFGQAILEHLNSGKLPQDYAKRVVESYNAASYDIFKPGALNPGHTQQNPTPVGEKIGTLSDWYTANNVPVPTSIPGGKYVFANDIEKTVFAFLAKDQQLKKEADAKELANNSVRPASPRNHIAEITSRPRSLSKGDEQISRRNDADGANPLKR